MNLHAYACCKEDIDEKIALLLEFDVSEDPVVRSEFGGDTALFDCYYEIAPCYMKKENLTEADKYFALAARSRFTSEDHAI